jgi:hypothetical protein
MNKLAITLENLNENIAMNRIRFALPFYVILCIYLDNVRLDELYQYSYLIG